MGKNNVKPNSSIQAKNKGLFLAFKIVIVISFIFVVGCTIFYFIEMGREEKSYFSLHFALPIILFLVGVIAILMNVTSKLSLSGESKGDRFMVGVGLLLILCSIVTIIISYL